jgi:hypothetical protein
MTTTALTLVNAVLRRLREAQVTDFSAAYSALILDFVNETKKEVEDAWQWSMLRQTITITTSSGTQNYAIPLAASNYDPDRWQCNDRHSRIFNFTTGGVIWPMDADLIEEYKWITTTTNAEPVNYCVAGSDGTNLTIDLYPTPNATYTLKMPLVTPKLDLSATTDTIAVPSTPVILGAWARAISERGEDQGVKTTDQYVLYQNSLGYYIALDAARFPNEIEWKPR